MDFISKFVASLKVEAKTKAKKPQKSKSRKRKPSSDEEEDNDEEEDEEEMHPFQIRIFNFLIKVGVSWGCYLYTAGRLQRFRV